MKKVFLDAGHSLITSGKRTPDDEREWSFNNKVLLSAEKHLKNNGIAVERLDDPSGKRDVPLQERTDKANKLGDRDDLLISIHHNANTGKWGEWTGTETYTYSSNVPGSEKLARLVHAELVKAYGLKDRGLKKANFHMLRESEMNAILLEGGYMDSVIDIKKLRDDKVLEAAGKGIAIGVCHYFGITFKELVVPSKPKTNVGGLYRVIVDGVQVGAFKDPSKAVIDAYKKGAKEITLKKI